MEGAFDPTRPAILFDLELTAWEGSMVAGWSRPGELREVIQIGAIRLGPGPDLPEQDAMSCLVRPVQNPVLSDYIVALTGITQDAIENEAITYPEAQERLDAFIGEPDMPAYCNGADHEILAENARWHAVAPPHRLGNMINFRRHLGGMLRVGPTDFHSIQVAELAGAGNTSDLLHDALNDVRIIATGLRMLIANGRL